MFNAERHLVGSDLKVLHESNARGFCFSFRERHAPFMSTLCSRLLLSSLNVPHAGILRGLVGNPGVFCANASGSLYSFRRGFCSARRKAHKETGTEFKDALDNNGSRSRDFVALEPILSRKTRSSTFSDLARELMLWSNLVRGLFASRKGCQNLRLIRH